jgi:RHS repeat-associated protein
VRGDRRRKERQVSELQIVAREALPQIMLARYYTPQAGRFLSTDPASDSADPTLPQTWNRYSYVGNNPLRYNDPTGEDGNDVANLIDRKVQQVVDFVDSATNEGTFTTALNDAATAAGALVSGAADMLRVGAATGEAIGTESTSLGQAVSQDVARGAALFTAIGGAVEGAGLAGTRTAAAAGGSEASSAATGTKITGFTIRVRLRRRSERSGKRATSSVLIGLTTLCEKEEKPWPERSLSESAASWPA